LKNLIRTLRSLKLQSDYIACCKITIKNGNATLSVTNNITMVEMAINVVEMAINVVDSREYYFKYSNFWNIIKKLKLDDNIRFIIQEKQLNIIVNETIFNILLIDCKYKNIFNIKINTEHSIIIKKDQNLIKEIRKQINFCSKDELKEVLTNVHFRINKNELKMIATDSIILNVNKIKINSEAEDNFTVPFEILKIISKQKTNDNIRMTFSNDYVKIKFDDMEFISKLIDTKYPNYIALTPTHNQTEIKFNRKDLIEGINLIKSSVNRYSQLIRLEINNNTMAISTDTETQKMNINKNNSDNFKFGINYKKLLTILKNYSEKYLLFNINSNDTNIIKKPLIIKNNSNLSLIMPTKIS